MAIAAHLDETAQAADGRREARRNLRLEAQGELESGRATNVLVHNVSTTGLLIESEIALAVGEAIAIDLPETGPRLAHVIWSSRNLFGCQFEAAITPAAMSAAQLRSAVAAPALEAEESFGLRLQRMRKAAGMSLSALAARLGVSKPTVWAWEQGRSRPVESRIAELAEAFDVGVADLVGGRDDNVVQDVVLRSRETIAAAFGTSPDKVRIMIEL
jgi:transcriptional regulator with XRE-family HTH domain